MGYHLAGFGDITGVDIKPQLRYPFRFFQGDALEYLAEHSGEYDVIHASPPCQGYSMMNNLPWLKGRSYSHLIEPTRAVLEDIGKPYVLENVMGARYGAKGLAKRGLEAHGLKAGWLCGTMFGLPFYRHRLFATNWFWLQLGHPKHQQRIRPGHSLAGRVRDIVSPEPKGNFDMKKLGGALPKSKGGNGVMALSGAWGETMTLTHAPTSRREQAARIMGIDWMKGDEISQAIPPAYTRYIGEQLLKELVGDA